MTCQSVGWFLSLSEHSHCAFHIDSGRCHWRNGLLSVLSSSIFAPTGSMARSQSPSPAMKKAGEAENPHSSISPDTETMSKRSLFSSVCIVGTCTLAMIANISNNTTVSIALPTIQRELHIPPVQLQWIVSAYPLSSGCLLLLFGRLADLYGRKKSFLLGSIWLIAFTLGCAFAKDSLTLDILRAVQGIGAAATIPSSIGTLAHSFPPSTKAQAIAFSTFAAGAPLGGALGFAFGGLLTELTEKTWRSPFYLSSALTFISLIGAIFSFDADKPSTEHDRRVDWIGAFLITVGLVLIVFVLGQVEVAPRQWSTSYIIVLLIFGVLFTILFLLWQYHLEHLHDILAPSHSHSGSESCSTPTSFTWPLEQNLPSWSRRLQTWLPSPPPLMKLSLWTRGHGRVAAVMAIAFLNWCCFMGFNYWVGLYYQDFLRLSPLQTVARLAPMFITGILCNVIVAAFINRIPMVVLVVMGTTLTSTAALLFALINPNAVYWAFGFPAAIIAVFGADFVFAPGTMYVSSVSQAHEQSVAGAVFQTVTQVGTSLGVAVSTVVFDHVSRNHQGNVPHQPGPGPGPGHPPGPPPPPPPPGLSSYHAAQWSNFAFGVLATIVGLVFLRGIRALGRPKASTAPSMRQLEADPEEKAGVA
ncbi:hypothetical protein D9758_008591 [Tetrapyrgos nigripes]|uniref:Major facilitator superfamily (MFS) profile domain-containing protein n=1 Tax=Tetrapyrgos nigripes TaxID=182062 RepID=A0A8H5LIU8_9AGAR|nr:hypothetical protein D9758_008591 [Tetrapyrgos nigripes]